MASKQQSMRVSLEIVPQDENYADLSAMNEVGRIVIEALGEEGYYVEPTYTGLRGSPELFDVVVPDTAHFAGVFHDGKDLLTSLFELAKPIAECLKEALNRQASKEKQMAKVTMIIGDISLLYDGTIAEELTEKFLRTYPEAIEKITPQTKIKVQASVPKRQPRRRR